MSEGKSITLLDKIKDENQIFNNNSSKGKGKSKASQGSDDVHLCSHEQFREPISSDSSHLDQVLKQATANLRKTKVKDDHHCADHVDTHQTVGSSKSVSPPQSPGDALADGTSAEMTTETMIFDTFMSLPSYKPRFINECTYMVTSNLQDLSIAKTAYWGKFTDFLFRDDAGQLRLIAVNEFISRVFYELRVQTHERIPQSSYTVVVGNGSLDQYKELQRTDDGFQLAIQSYDSARSKDLDQNKFMWFHFHFFSKPPSYKSPGPAPKVTNQLLYRLQFGYYARLDNTDKKDESELEGSSPEAKRRLQRSRSPQSTSRNPYAGQSGNRGMVHRRNPRPDKQSTLPVASTPVQTTPSTSKKTTSGESTVRCKLLSRLPKVPVPSRIRNVLSGSSSRNQVAAAEQTVDVPLYPLETPTILTALGPDIKQGGIEDLNGLLPVTASPSMDQWKKCCRLIPDLDPTQLMLDVRARSIRLRHSNLYITPVQLYSAYQILQGGSGFLCHEMGLGKTHTVLATVALKALVVGSKRRCDADWGSPFSSRHLLPNASQAGLECPSQSKRPGDVQCYCVPDGVTRQIYDALSPGASLIHIPSSARATWLEAITQAEFRTGYDFLFVSNSPDVPENLRRNLQHLKSFFKMGAVEKKQVVRDAFDLNWTSHVGFEGLGTHVFVVLHSDPTWYNAFRYRPSELRPRPQPDCIFDMKDGACYAAPISLTFIDEAHMDGVWKWRGVPMIMARYVLFYPTGRVSTNSHFFMRSLANKYSARSHKHIVRAQTWFVTGTPFSMEGLTNLENPLHLIDSELAGRIPGLIELHKDGLQNRTQEHILDFTDRFRYLFGPDIILRFIHQNVFLGQPISNIQNVQPIIVSRRLSRTGFTKAQVQSLVANIRAGLETSLSYVDALEVSSLTREVRDDLYFVALFPAAAKLITDQKINVHERAIREAIRSLENRKDVFAIPEVQQFWQEVVKDSPKTQLIIEEVDRMNADRRARRGVVKAGPARPGQKEAQVDPVRKKMVIVTPTTASAVYLYMYLRNTPEHQRRGIGPVLYHQDLSLSQRTALQDDFRSLDPERPGARTARTIIGSFDAIGTGINLQSANYQIFASPLPRADQLHQGFARTNRQDQTLPLEHKIFVLEDSPIDRINMANLARRRFKSDPYDLSEEPEFETTGSPL